LITSPVIIPGTIVLTNQQAGNTEQGPCQIHEIRHAL